MSSLCWTFSAKVLPNCQGDLRMFMNIPTACFYHIQGFTFGSTYYEDQFAGILISGGGEVIQ